MDPSGIYVPTPADLERLKKIIYMELDAGLQCRLRHLGKTLLLKITSALRKKQKAAILQSDDQEAMRIYFGMLLKKGVGAKISTKEIEDGSCDYRIVVSLETSISPPGGVA